MGGWLVGWLFLHQMGGWLFLHKMGGWMFLHQGWVESEYLQQYKDALCLKKRVGSKRVVTVIHVVVVPAKVR